MSKKELKEVAVVIAINIVVCYAIYRVLIWVASSI